MAATEIKRDPDLEWLDHVQPVGLVVAPTLLKELTLVPPRQTQADSAAVAELLKAGGAGTDDVTQPALRDPWAFMAAVLGWEARHVAGSPGGPPLDDKLSVRLPEHDTTLAPTWAVKELGTDGEAPPWQLLVRIEEPGVDPDGRGAVAGWEATPHQRFERLLRESGVQAGLLISECNDRNRKHDGRDRYLPELRLVYAPRGETSGYLSFPVRSLSTVAGRPMLGGLKLLLDSYRLFNDAGDRRLPSLLKKSREAQAEVSTALAEQVLGALHELLRGLAAADPDVVRELAARRPGHLYEGLLTVLMRLVFILYAEDRDLLPSRTDGRASRIYETSYSLRGLYARLTEDAALNPDTMDERRGGWGQLLALFRLIQKGHPSRFVQARGGKLFDPDQFPFLEGRGERRSVPSPVAPEARPHNVGEGQGGGDGRTSEVGVPPTPNPSPQGGGESGRSGGQTPRHQPGAEASAADARGLTPSGEPRVLPVSDGHILRILEGLMTLQVKGGGRERLSYRTLDVEQIGSVYETVMGFTVETAAGRALAIRAGKNNRTPVFVDLDRLAAAKGRDRIKFLKEEANRGQLSASVAKAVEQAKTADDLAAALDPIVDERGSPRRRVVAAGTPILQPTDERRRTGSHYTPRSLTEPIVRHALEPAFARLGPDATPDAVLALKLCDPAMGSGAFLVEACRALAARLVQAWERHKDEKPAIPPDEDEELHARRLVAQRCLYGVDKNPLATDLARLSLWLATLARDHEFTFLDHALKSGDSLVGLSRVQIAAAHWDLSKPGLPLFRKLVTDRVAEAMQGRAEIQSAPDDTTRAIQEQKHRFVEDRIKYVRLIGDAVIAAFFAKDKPKARERKRAEVESWLMPAGKMEADWDKLAGMAATLRQGEHPLRPFHWQIEFPEVFARDNGGFDAMIGNPPFLGGKAISTNFGGAYSWWLEMSHTGGTRSADLVAHFFRSAFALLRQGGCFGLIATNTIGQGDTRATGLAQILAAQGSISRAVKRLPWPGEAAVIVSVVHVVRGPTPSPVLDGRRVHRISAYLVAGDMDGEPARLSANARKAFQGSIILGMGFTFDDTAGARGDAESLATMRGLIERDPRNAERIAPYIGGEEVNTSPTHAYYRYAIDFFDRPLRRDASLAPWATMDAKQRARCRTIGIVPADYPDEVAEDWPDLIEIVRRRVKPIRDEQNREALRTRWWQYADKRPGLYNAIVPLKRVLTCSRIGNAFAFTFLPNGWVYNEKTVIFVSDKASTLASLSSRIHETWARFLSSTLKDDLQYTPSDCFETFPFPPGFETDPALEAAGRAYHDHRAALMVARNEGMTKTYNRFHDRGETAADIVRLRELHAAMDRAVLAAYGWPDLAERADPIFLDEASEDDHTYQGRLFWPSPFRDEVLSRLLALNASRHTEEVAAGIAPGMKGKAAGEDEDDEAGE